MSAETNTLTSPAPAPAPAPALQMQVVHDRVPEETSLPLVTGDLENPKHPVQELRIILIKIVSGPLGNLVESIEGKLAHGVPKGPLQHRGLELVSSLKKQLHDRHIIRIPGYESHGGAVGVPPKRRIPRSLYWMVCVPTALAFLYFGFMASDQYECTAGYVIKSNDTASSPVGALSLLGMGVGDSATANDAAMVESYIGSMQILRDLEKELDLRKMYASREIDRFSRMKPSWDFFKTITFGHSRRTTSREVSDEDLLEYWKKKIEVTPGKGSANWELTVRGFTPEDTKKVADQVLLLSERLVNNVSERALNDALEFSRKQVETARQQALRISEELKESQIKTQHVDPLSAAKSEYASKDYLSALAGLETARINASRQSRYLEAFALPQLPDKPALPRRWYSIISVLAVCLLLWGVWSLFIAGVKEHQH